MDSIFEMVAAEYISNLARENKLRAKRTVAQQMEDGHIETRPSAISAATIKNAWKQYRKFVKDIREDKAEGEPKGDPNWRRKN